MDVYAEAETDQRNRAMQNFVTWCAQRAQDKAKAEKKAMEAAAWRDHFQMSAVTESIIAAVEASPATKQACTSWST